MRGEGRVHETRPLLILLVSFLGFYGGVEYLFIAGKSSPGVPGIADIVVLALISFLNIIPAGLFAFGIVSALPKSLRSSYDENYLLSLRRGSKKARVAVLYPTFNDFMAEYAEYDATEAQSNGLSFFILDDSTDPRKRIEVEDFALKTGCPLVRRNSRRGYKAGAINNWIKRFGGGYDYFFLLDSDSQASYRSIAYSIDIATRDLSIAVVQTKTLAMTATPTKLTESGVTIQHAHMEVVQAAMKNLGTSPYYGHNALINIQAVRSIGGFIEQSNEDYKTLSKLHSKGYRSIYAERAVTWEEVPPDYLSSRKRSLRWSRDSVAQLGLMGRKVPLAVSFYLFFGWVGYMANLALVAFLSLLSFGGLPNNIFGGASLGEIAGSLTMSIIIAWPLIALRSGDSQLTPKKLARAAAWGSIASLPTAWPITIQILKTAFSRAIGKAGRFWGHESKEEEFTVTPKQRETAVTGSLGVLSQLKAEIFLGLVPIIIAISSGATWALVFAAPQLISVIGLPLLVLSEHGVLFRPQSTSAWPRAHGPYYFPRASPLQGPMPQLVNINVR